MAGDIAGYRERKIPLSRYLIVGIAGTACGNSGEFSTRYFRNAILGLFSDNDMANNLTPNKR